MGGAPTMQYTDDVSYRCILKAYIILLTNVTPISLIKINLNLKSNQRVVTNYFSRDIS